MKRIMPLNLIVLAVLVGFVSVAHSASAAPVSAPHASSAGDTLWHTDTIYVHVPVTVFDIEHDTLYNPAVLDTVYSYPECHALSVAVDSLTPWGKVSGNGAFPDGTEVEIAAIADKGFRFLRWADGNTDNPRRVVVEGAMAFVALFDSLAPRPVMAKDGPRPDNADTIIRDTVVVYVFDTTFLGGRDTVYITPHDTLFLDTIPYHTMLVLSGDEERGEVAGNGLFPEGAVVEIAALPRQGYRFVHWHDVNRENPRRVLMDEVQFFVAEFAPDTATTDDPDPDPDPEPWDAVLHFQVSGTTLTVTSPASAVIRIFTPDGRLVALSEPVGDRFTEAVRSFLLPNAGVYLVQVGRFPVRKFVLM